MDSTDRSKQGGVDDAKQSASALNFDASSLSSDGTTLKISHDDNAPKPTSEPEPAPQPAPESVSSPEPQPLDHPTQPIPPAQPTGVPVNPLARKAPTFIGNSQASRTAQFAQQTGDIMLQPTQPPKKSKTPLIIGSIILGLLVVGLVVFLIFTSFKTNQQTAQQLQLSPTFNKYANYLLYEKDSEDNITEHYASNTAYAFFRIGGSSNTEQRTSYLDKLQKLFNDFYNASNKSDNIVAYYNQFSLAYMLADQKPILDEQATIIWDQPIVIIEQNPTNETLDTIDKTMTQYLQNSYKKFLDADTVTVQEYGQKNVQYWQEYMIPIFNKVLDRGKVTECLTQPSQEIHTCLLQSYKTTSESTSARNLQREIINLQVEANKSIIDGCWDIAQEMGTQ